jgi:hypothetical protein
MDGLIYLLKYLETRLDADSMGAIVTLVKRWTVIFSHADEWLCMEDEVFDAMCLEKFPKKLLMDFHFDKDLIFNEMQQDVLDALCNG